MSLVRIADFTLKFAPTFAMVELNMAAIIMPINPWGSSVKLATAYDASLTLFSPGQTLCRSGYTIRMAIGGINHKKAPTTNNPAHNRAILRAERSLSTLK